MTRAEFACCATSWPVEVIERFAEAAPNSVCENLYGPTELTIACTLYRWDRERSPGDSDLGVVPIGEPYPGMRVLVAEGIIDATLPQRLKAAIEGDELIVEIWLRSRGGDAHAGNEAGKVIRSFPGMVTRIPAGWTCFSACNFVFMGGDGRFVDPGGTFMVHMFTHTGDRESIYLAAEEGTAETVRLIADIEQASALLATEDNDFLIRMGVSRKLLSDIMYKQQAVRTEENPSTRYCLSQEEVVRYNVGAQASAG